MPSRIALKKNRRYNVDNTQTYSQGYNLCDNNNSMENATVRSNRRTRLLALIVTMVIFTGVFQLSAFIEVEEQERQEVNDMIIGKMETVDGKGIFFNNVYLGLMMFIPFVGFAFGVMSSALTGVTFSAIAQVHDIDLPAFMMLFGSPFGFMELVAYSIAMSRSVLIFNKLRKKETRKFTRTDIKYIFAEVGIVVGLLLVGGMVEAYMIGNTVF